MNIYFKDGKPFGNPEPRPEREVCKSLIFDLWDFKTVAEYQKEIVKWQKSSIAIKEPEFKDKDIVFDKKTAEKCRIDKKGMKEGEAWVLNMTGSIGGILLNKEQLNRLFSHYYEGQVLDENQIEYEK